ncbi:hypothetical protein DRN50_08580, partial [Thermococci archaeon]
MFLFCFFVLFVVFCFIEYLIYISPPLINRIMEIELSSLYGLEMYTDKGVRVGEIENVSVDIKEKRVAGLAVKNINPNVFAFDLGSEGRRRGV